VPTAASGEAEGGFEKAEAGFKKAGEM